MAVNFTHIALHVRDVESCVAFYREFCGLELVHERFDDKGRRIVWMAEPGREDDFVFVLLPGGGRDQDERDFSHFGFAMPDRDAVDAVARREDVSGLGLPRGAQEDAALQVRRRDRAGQRTISGTWIPES